MIRIAIAWDDETGEPLEFAEFANVHADRITPLQGLRFDQDLAELAAHGFDLGVKRWTEAVFWLKRFSAEAATESEFSARLVSQAVAAIEVSDDPEAARAAAEQVAEAEAERLEVWMVSHPRYELARQVAIWAAVNGSRRMTLLEVLQLRPVDVEEYPEPEEYIDTDRDAGPAGKA